MRLGRAEADARLVMKKAGMEWRQEGMRRTDEKEGKEE